MPMERINNTELYISRMMIFLWFHEKFFSSTLKCHVQVMMKDAVGAFSLINVVFPPPSFLDACTSPFWPTHAKFHLRSPHCQGTQCTLTTLFFSRRVPIETRTSTLRGYPGSSRNSGVGDNRLRSIRHHKPADKMRFNKIESSIKV